MTLEEFQIAARRTINPSLSDRDRLLDAAIGLAEEAAEVAGLVRKRVLQGRAIEDARMIEELGDVLWCLAITADALGLSLETIAAANVVKLWTRHPNGFRTPSDQP